MRLAARTTVEQSPGTVWAFLADPSTASSWDASIAEVIPSSTGAPAVGWEAETLSPRGKRQRFRIPHYEDGRLLSFVLLDDPTFDHAELSFLLEPAGAGTRIVHIIEGRTRNRALGFVLTVVGRRALARDPSRLRATLRRLPTDP
ncbi:SRPBCC family protein [Sciscionella marina]|uniref:SRPBCC family protein n=1 Tax=Sciscionella marina TaxID=508770 RepID=UPI000362B55D|nr:SRPBCC family protein [Sciscionella marina]